NFHRAPDNTVGEILVEPSMGPCSGPDRGTVAALGHVFRSLAKRDVVRIHDYAVALAAIQRRAKTECVDSRVRWSFVRRGLLREPGHRTLSIDHCRASCHSSFCAAGSDLVLGLHGLCRRMGVA